MANGGRITIEELNRKMADPNVPDQELATYFKSSQPTAPMTPALALDESRVAVEEAPAARSAALLNSANWIARSRRRIKYNRRVGSGSYTGPIVVSEGDSWYQYPFLLKDVIDWLMDDFAVFDLSAGGDTLQNMAREMEVLDALQDTGGSILLLSGGGNDLVAGGNLAAHLRQHDPNGGMRPEDYLLPSFDLVLDEAIALIDRIVRDVGRSFPHVQVACHGYDYAIPNNGPWLGGPMGSRAIPSQLQAPIAAVMVDRLNARLKRLAEGLPRLTYVDVRGVVRDHGWYDELHPQDPGYGAVAGYFRRFVAEVGQQPRAVAHGVRSARPALAEVANARPPIPRSELPRPRLDASPHAAKGRSLHVGINLVDPQHYAGWDGPLELCEFDANDMEALARAAGFEHRTKLLTHAATRDNVVGAIRTAAAESVPGDIFLFTISCHGGQVPDFNRDEQDGIDETLCLYDAQLIDDELHALWSEFRPGVRVLVLSDSCHSGSVVKAQRHAALGEQRLSSLGRPRYMPSIIAAKTARQNRDFYFEKASRIPSRLSDAVTRAMASPVGATVRLISGCLDHQYSYEAVTNGRFTGAVLEVWGQGGFQGDYAAFHQTILDRMPIEQTPNHMTIGAANPAYDTQRPFEI